MKKKLLGIALCALLSLPLAARESDSGLGFSLGARFSVLGLEPTVSLLFNHLEVEASAPLQSKHVYETKYDTDGTTVLGQELKGYTFGFAPEVSIGYNSKPFTSGWQNGFGFTALWVTDNYLSAFMGTSDSSGISSFLDSNGKVDFTQGAYLGSFYYRGAIQWKGGFSLYFRITVPLAAYVPSMGDAGFYSIMEPEFATAAVSAAFLGTAVGIRFTF